MQVVMSMAERHNYILDVINRDGFVKAADIAEKLGVTMVTVRRDLKALEEQNLLYRTYGSARAVNPHITDRNVREKEKLNIDEKNKIGEAAATLIKDNDSIIINSGSTVCAFVEKLGSKPNLTVVSASIKATMIMYNLENINIIQLGGNFRRQSMSIIGNHTVGLLRDINSSKLFLGVDGLDLDVGATASSIEEAELNRAMMKASLKTIVLCDSTKFGKRGFSNICDLDQIDTIITDSGITHTMRKALEEQGIEVIIA